MRGLVLVVAVAAADQPLLLCSPAGRDGFGSQYFHHMSVWGFCAAHGNCCYVHSKLQRVAHGADISRAEALTGLHSGEACRGLLQSPRRPGSQLPDDEDGASMGCTNGRLIREGPTADWTMKSLIYPKRVDGRAQAKYALWQHQGDARLGHDPVRSEGVRERARGDDLGVAQVAPRRLRREGVEAAPQRRVARHVAPREDGPSRGP